MRDKRRLWALFWSLRGQLLVISCVHIQFTFDLLPVNSENRNSSPLYILLKVRYHRRGEEKTIVLTEKRGWDADTYETKNASGRTRKKRLESAVARRPSLSSSQQDDGQQLGMCIEDSPSPLQGRTL